MESEYIGTNENGVLKRFIRTVVQTCQTLECKTFNTETRTQETEREKDSSDNNNLDLDLDLNKKNEEAESSPSSSSGITYIEDAISELAKKRIVNLDKDNEKDTYYDLQDIHTLTDTIMKLKSKFDSSQIDDTLDKMRNEVSSSIQQALHNKNNVNNENKNKDQLINESDNSKKPKTDL